jgi:hypothetical protein
MTDKDSPTDSAMEDAIPLSSEEEFRSVCSPVLSGQSIDLLIKQFRHFYPNGIKLKGEKS